MKLQIFENDEFGSVRILMNEDGKILFCGSDVAKALGYQEPHKAVRRHAKGGMKHPIPTDGGMQELVFIPEPDVYRLIFRSKLPSAMRFEEWVVETVLPTIRKYGAYITPEVLTAMGESPEFTTQLIRMLLPEQEKNTAYQEAMAAVAVKTDYFDSFMETDTLTNIRNTAKELHIPERLFTHLLVEMGIVYRHGNRLWPNAFMVHYRYAVLRDYVSDKHGGTYMLFTPLGKLYLQRRIAQRLALKNTEVQYETDHNN